MIETAVIAQIKALLRAPEIVVATWRQVQGEDPTIPEQAVREALHRFDPLWQELFPAEQTRLVQLLVERVDIGRGCAHVRLRIDGLRSVANDLMARVPASDPAAGQRRAA